ncbi:MAG TPA: hypothetical protein VF026_27020 [Ktedonobacteraceae bacterium]
MFFQPTLFREEDHSSNHRYRPVHPSPWWRIQPGVTGGRLIGEAIVVVGHLSFWGNGTEVVANGQPIPI